MKKLLSLFLVAPFSLSACGTSPSTINDSKPNQDQPTTGIDETKPLTLKNIKSMNALYHTPDSISGMWTKDYSETDMNIINNLWKSTIAVHIFDSKLSSVSGTTDRNKCENIISRQSEIGDVLAPERVAPYMDKAANDWLKKKSYTDENGVKKDIPKFTHFKGGENDYQNAGTGWIIGQNNSHYFVATNHHVGLKPSAVGATGEYAKFGKNGPGEQWDCLGMGLINDGEESYISGVDYSVGDNGLVFNGRDQKHGSKEWIDMAIFAVKKSNFGVAMPSLKISQTVKKQSTWDDTKTAFKNLIENTTLYTTGYPRTVRRHAKADTLVKHWYARSWYKDEGRSIDIKDENGNVTETVNYQGIWDGTRVWQFDQPEIEFALGGGASGSPIINPNGEIEFLFAAGQTNSGRLVDNDEWTSGAAVGVPAYQIWEQINAEFCINNQYNLDIDFCK